MDRSSKDEADASAVRQDASSVGKAHETPLHRLQMMSLEAVADHLQVSESHLRREIRLKKLSCHRFGRLIRVSEADLTLYLAARRKGAR